MPGFNVHFSTLTNVADEREYWTFHDGMAATSSGACGRSASSRPAACRTASRSRATGRTRRSTRRPTRAPLGRADAGRLGLLERRLDAAHPQPHQLTPGFAWSGTGLSRTGRRRRALARLRLHRQAVREPGHDRLAGRRPGVGAAGRRAARVAADGKDLQDAIDGKCLGFGAQRTSSATTARCSGPAELRSEPRPRRGAAGRRPGRPARLEPDDRSVVAAARRSPTTAGRRAATGGRSSRWRDRPVPIRHAPGRDALEYHDIDASAGRLREPGRCGRSACRARR